MPVHRSHGKQRVEVPRIDELPAGLPENARPESPPERGPDGRFLPGASSSASKGGRRRGGALTLARKLGLKKGEESALAPYLRHADAWRRHKVSELAATVGAGHCGAGPSSIVATAARQLASSMYLFDLAVDTDSADPDLHARASKLGADSRASLLAAHELCRLEAASRPQQNATLALIERIQGKDRDK